MSIFDLNAQDCKRRAANSENMNSVVSEISEKINEAVNKGLGSVSVDVYMPSYNLLPTDEEVGSARRNLIGALESDGFKVVINEANGRWFNITISWHGVSEENEHALVEVERDEATKKFEHEYKQARAKVRKELFDLKVKALELNPDYLATIEEVRKLEDEMHEIACTGALGFVRDYKHANELRQRYFKVRDALGDALRKYNTYEKSITEIKIHYAVDVIHAREVLKNLLLYGFNRK